MAAGNELSGTEDAGRESFMLSCRFRLAMVRSLDSVHLARWVRSVLVKAIVYPLPLKAHSSLGIIASKLGLFLSRLDLVSTVCGSSSSLYSTFRTHHPALAGCPDDLDLCERSESDETELVHTTSKLGLVSQDSMTRGNAQSNKGHESGCRDRRDATREAGTIISNHLCQTLQHTHHKSPLDVMSNPRLSSSLKPVGSKLSGALSHGGNISDSSVPHS